MEYEVQSALRSLPSIDKLITDFRHRRNVQIDDQYLTVIVRQIVSAARGGLLEGDASGALNLEERITDVVELVAAGEVTTVINGTGVIVHTNLGRSPVSEAAAAAMATAARNYLPLELRLESGERGGRGEELSSLMQILTGAESTLVVNNNAAAILLTLSAHCQGRSVIVSRGEAVEIGGGFRIPDVLRQSGAHLVEVGTTNRTNLRDYARAIDESTAAILRVHASNFDIRGFTAKPQLEELAELAQQSGILLIEDVGSGCLVETSDYGLEHEPTLSESVSAGVDVVTASGDKLLGGPQAGLILGTSAAVEIVRRHPLARAVRTDKATLAGLAATLRHYLRREQNTKVPIWWMMSQSPGELNDRAERWRSAINHPGCTVTETQSVTGGGSLPGKMQRSFGVSICTAEGYSTAELARQLRTSRSAVFPRVEQDQVIIDARTVLENQDEALIDTIRQVLS